MSVKLRLARGGAKKKPFYRIVVADVKFPRDGRITEKVGYYDPVAQPQILEIKMDRVEFWLSKGVKPTDTVRKLLRIQKKKLDGVQAK
jgi:small subunit ribosomal protein S16